MVGTIAHQGWLNGLGIQSSDRNSVTIKTFTNFFSYSSKFNWMLFLHAMHMYSYHTNHLNGEAQV